MWFEPCSREGHTGGDVTTNRYWSPAGSLAESFVHSTSVPMGEMIASLPAAGGIGRRPNKH
eukprot:scaffold1306_cov399-Prasinococcus_capsulatus_cf.AAC.15